MSYLLLIDSRVSDIDAILLSLTPNTDYIVFKYDEDTFDTLQTKISATLKQYTHIAIAQHKYGISTYSLIADMTPGLLFDYVDGTQVGVSEMEPTITSWQQFADFIVWLKINVGMQVLDLLACELWADPNWVYVIQTLKQQCTISIRASIDITGIGGDFILESDNVDLIGIYFTEKIVDYKYSFVGNDFITLVNTKAPWGVYSANKYSNITNKLYELRNTGRDATVSGTLTPGKASGNGATNPIQYLNGTTSTTITWPAGSVPTTHTFAFITRYQNATNAKRILTGDTTNNPNAIIGHHNGRRGNYYINGWATNTVNYGTATNWLVMVCKIGGTTPNNVLIDGVALGTAALSAAGASGTLGINTYAENSDFGFSYLMIWDQALTNAEMVIVSGQLQFYLNTGNAPPLPNAFKSIMHARRPWGIYRAIDWVSGTNTLPEARGITSRNATKGGTGAVTFNSSTTGNGANANITSISGLTTTQLAWPAGSIPATYTLAFITRMTGSYNRTLQGGTNNLAFGHWGAAGNRGVYLDKGSWVNSTSYGTITNWLPMVCKVGANPNNCIVDGTSRGTASSTALSADDQLYINNGALPTQISNWEFSYLIVWDQALSDAQAAVVSTELLSYLGTGNLPETFGYVLNGYFTAPSLSANTFTEYTSSLSSILYWTVNVTNARIYIANTSTSWGYSTLPAGVVQWIVFQYNSVSSGSHSMSQTIYFDVSGTYTLTYYTQSRPSTTNSVITLGASIAGMSQSSVVSSNSAWELRTLSFVLNAASSQTLTFTTSFSGGSTDCAVYLTAVNVVPSDAVIAVPGAPTLSSVTAGNQQLTVAFTAPASNGGSPITTYKYSLNNGALVDAATTTSPFTISGLAMNTEYSVYIVATNAIGNSSSSNVISATTWGAPSAPTLSSVTSGNQQLTVAFTASSSNGGTAITTYKYSLNGGALVDAATTTSPFTISGLATNTEYSVYIVATNAIGDSSNSNVISATTWNYPSVPTLSSVTSGNQQLTVAFDAPSSNGGTAITTYKYSLNGGALVDATTTTSPFTISGLAINTEYSVYIVATNAIGDSSNSNVISATTWNYPSAPTLSSVTAGNQQLTVAFTAPSSDGGSAITTYKYSLNGGALINAATTTSPFTISDLSVNTEYSVYIVATNVIGDSSNSNSIATTTWNYPSAPTITSVTGGKQQISIAFTPPVSNGGSTVTDYLYSINDGVSYQSAGTTTSPIVVTGLTGGQTYSVYLKAVNTVGQSATSNNVSSLAYDVVTKPTITVVSSVLSVNITDVSYSSNNGSPAIAYWVSTNNTTWTSVGNINLPLNINNLVAGVTYPVSLKVENAYGLSAASTSVSIQVSDYPSPPVITSISSMDVSGTLYVSYQVPTYTGYNPITHWKYSINNGVSYTTYSGDISDNPIVLTGLTNGQSYSIGLKTTTIMGDSSASNIVTKTLLLRPMPPTITQGIPGFRRIILYFTAPSSVGYSTNYYYTYSLNGGADISLNTLQSPYSITGLTDQTYTVTMKTVNEQWTSVSSNSVSVTPYLISGAPTVIVNSLNPIPRGLSVDYTVYGDAITAVYYSLNGSADISTNSVSSPLLIQNLVEGATYSIQIKAENEGGLSAYSDISYIILPYLYNSMTNPVSIVSNGEMFIMTIKNEVNDNYNYKYSYDGVNWSSDIFPSTHLSSHNPNQIKWTGNEFVVCGNLVNTSSLQPILLKSKVGTTDFSIVNTSISPSIQNTIDIEYNSQQPHSIFFPQDTTIVCSPHQLATSNDGGISWTIQTTSNIDTIFGTSIISILWMGTQWIAIGSGANVVATSVDGIKWVASHYTGLSSVKSIAWNEATHTLMMVGDGSYNSVAVSVDGIFWTGLGKSIVDSGENVAWNGQEWVIYGTKNAQSVIVTSNNGYTWSTPQSVVFPTFLPNLYNQTQYLKIDVSGELVQSYDNATWSIAETPFQTHTALGWNRSSSGFTTIYPLTFALGQGANHTMAYSYDGIFWTGLGKHIFDICANDIVWNGQYWVAVGSSSAAWCASSVDGLVWTTSPDTGFQSGYFIGWNGTVFLALGSISNQIAVSVDGMEWEYVTITGANMGQTSYAHWNGNMWSIFTNNNSSSIYYTTNILGNGGWQLIQTNAPYTNVAITPRAIYAQSQTPGIFMKYTPNMELVDLSYNLPTITSEIQSCCYDGSNVLIGCSDGSVGMFDDVSYTTIKNGMTTPIHLSYNNRFVIIGEKDGVIWYGQTPNYNTGYNLPLTTINKVKSNSKYGYVYTPNTIYYNTGDQIHIVSPKYLTVPNTTINAQLMSIHM